MPLLSTHCSYFENRLIWNLTYSPDDISRETATQIAEVIKKKLLDIAEGDHTNHTHINSY